MALLGSTPAFNSRTVPSTTNIPASASNPTELKDSTLGDITSAEFVNATAKDVNVYLGADAALKLLLTVGSIASGVVVSARQPIVIPMGSRISIRAADNSAISTGGAFIINGWL